MWPAYIVLGVAAGIAAGLFGIGGGIILIPVMVYCFGLTQHQAQGTTLAVLVPPIGLLAAWRYYAAGNVKMSMAVFICLGFFLGGLVGANFAQKIDDMVLRRSFGAVLFLISLKMLAGK